MTPAGETARLEEIVPLTSRIIEVDPDDIRLGTDLIESGFERYLAIAGPDSPPELRSMAGRLGGRFLPIWSREAAIYNNASLLIYGSRGLRYLLLYRGFREARHIAYTAAAIEKQVWARIALWLYRRSAVVGPGRLVRVGTTTLVIHEVTRHVARRGPRSFLPPHLPLRQVFEQFARAKVEYVVLRWFDEAPPDRAGEDVDLLVAGPDCDIVRRILESEPGVIPCDVYASDGRNGHDYAGIAYYQPDLAQRIFARSIDHPSGCRVPDDWTHFMSLAYHALYHKGFASGLPSRLTSRRHQGERPGLREERFAATLSRLARSLSMSVEISMEGLDDLLASNSWRPNLDTLAKLALHNDWVVARFFAGEQPVRPWIKGVGLFVIRDIAVELGYADDVLQALADAGLRILAVVDINEQARPFCLRMMRGARWEGGGGGPAIAVVVMDDGPRPVGSRRRLKHPSLDNDRIYTVKQQIRASIRDRVGRDVDAIHSADSSREAADYLRVIADGFDAQELRNCAMRDDATEQDLVRALAPFARIDLQLVPGARRSEHLTFAEVRRRTLIVVRRRAGAVGLATARLGHAVLKWMIVDRHEGRSSDSDQR